MPATPPAPVGNFLLPVRSSVPCRSRRGEVQDWRNQPPVLILRGGRHWHKWRMKMRYCAFNGDIPVTQGNNTQRIRRRYAPLRITAKIDRSDFSISEKDLLRTVRRSGLLRGKPADVIAMLDHLHHRLALFRECSGGADLHALAAAGAVARLAPIVLQVADDARVDAARGNLPDMRSFHLRTHPHAACAQDAAILIEDEAGMRHIDGETRIVVGVAHVGDAQLLRHCLKLAMAV